MEIQEIITKWKLNKNFLASKLKMLKGTFNNKLNPAHAEKFTEDEFILLRAIMLDLRKDLDIVNEISFDEAMKIIAKQKVKSKEKD
jgi:hypothetical protein